MMRLLTVAVVVIAGLLAAAARVQAHHGDVLLQAQVTARCGGLSRCLGNTTVVNLMGSGGKCANNNDKNNNIDDDDDDDCISRCWEDSGGGGCCTVHPTTWEGNGDLLANSKCDDLIDRNCACCGWDSGDYCCSPKKLDAHYTACSDVRPGGSCCLNLEHVAFHTDAPRASTVRDNTSSGPPRATFRTCALLCQGNTVHNNNNHNNNDNDDDNNNSSSNNNWRCNNANNNCDCDSECGDCCGAGARSPMHYASCDKVPDGTCCLDPQQIPGPVATRATDEETRSCSDSAAGACYCSGM